MALSVVACGSDETPLPLVDIPAKLQPTAGETLRIVAPAVGVRIYECRAKADRTGYEWAFVAPEATLLDEGGRTVGRHYAGPHWEASDGSKVLGAVKERENAPSGNAIPWLWLTTKSVGHEGAFSKTTSILRVRTVGGVAPATGCAFETQGSIARVEYRADYYFYAAN